MDIRSVDEPAIEIQIGAKPDACVIWLHGLGADGHDFETIVPALELPSATRLRFIFPHAPYRPVTINNGHVMRAWYDIAASDQGFDQNVEHIHESQVILQGLIENEIKRGIPSERIVLAGFSQGGAIALHTGLRYPQLLAGIMSLSAPVPFIEELMAKVHHANIVVPLFMAQGTDDRMISYAKAEQAAQKMLVRGLPVEWHTYVMGHTLVPEEIRDISRWLQRVLPLNSR